MTQSGEVVSHRAHNPGTGGANPSSATKFVVWHKYHTNFYCRLTCNGKYTIIGTMMKQQFCSMTKPQSLQSTNWLLANGFANSIPGEPGF